MKVLAASLLLPLALAAVVDDVRVLQAQVAEIPHLMSQPLYRRFANGRKQNPFAALLGGAKGGPKPKSNVPVESEVTQSSLYPNAQRKSVRYGPYRLPSPKEKNIESLLLKVNGMTDTFENAKKPCERCVIFSSIMELQDADGKEVKDAWLHHGGVMMSGSGLVESMCGLPGIQGLFEQGNEKTELPKVDATGGLKVGYHIEPHYKFMLSNEFVNMRNDPQWVWASIAYDYIEGEHPEYLETKSLLLSVGLVPSCTGGVNKWGSSNLTLTGQPRPNLRTFAEHSTPWRAPYAGTLIGAGGHLHDGGTNVEIYLRDKMVCNSQGVYKAGAANEHGMGGSYDPTQEHLASMSACSLNEPLNKGDEIRIVAQYNFEKHAGMKNNKGVLDEVMGMSGIVIATPYKPAHK